MVRLQNGLMAGQTPLAEDVRVIHLQDCVLYAPAATDPRHANGAEDVHGDPVATSDNRPKGSATGSDAMIVKGWMKLSNCAASTM